MPVRSTVLGHLTVIRGALVLALLLTAAIASGQTRGTITTCEAIGCGGRYFYCGSYGWGGPAPGSRDCYTNRLPGQGN